ncbi:hypothetical protein BDB00DRAFT_799048 [Zychaea mexicana]|uniref:uncharacterized protein n=1 Tax=Zychaea mexicana TaxID=64656 RepID=UPI0022FE6F7D|nr:uncharacterized protein BDB00DRAFT_799048 [Zychaea mexicana]KAI9498669.1 hypothetical protein BDB00DRAFT_799048 [Zychaea mexicana]
MEDDDYYYGTEPPQQQRALEQQFGNMHLNATSSTDRVICGPLLRYIGIDYATRTYRASCLLVCTDTQPPPLQIHLRNDQNESHAIQSQGELLDVFRSQYHFWRYELRLPLTSSRQIVTYSSDAFSPQEFHLPAYNESMRFMFYSCSGFSDIPQETKDKFGEKENPLWADVLDRHNVMPFHVLLGGGDQLYQDRLIKEDFMKPWTDEKHPSKRLAMDLSTEMREGLEKFFFWNYVLNFGAKGNPVVAKAYATIPSVNMWDDHDIIDGYGSYPADMQSSSMFQVLFANACRFYYLFQHHTTMELAPRHGMLRGSLPTCNHIVTTLGPDIALLALDCRGERTKYDVCRPKSYDIVFTEIYRSIPPSVKHLLVVTGVPLIYPRLSTFESAMEGISTFNLATIAGKTGALGSVISGPLNKWNGDPELLDDMNDHWTAGNHLLERKKFIEKLQLYAREKSARVSFLGGDVHCCGAGRLYSKDMRDKEEGDPFFMVQIISSAIINIPPPQALLTILNQNSTYNTFNGNVEEKMYKIFIKSPSGNTRQNTKLMGRRNYCAGYFDDEKGTMNFWIQAEKNVGQKGTMGYHVNVPKLIFGEAGHNQATMSKEQLLQVFIERQQRQPPQQQQQIEQHMMPQQHHHHHHPHIPHHIGGFFKQ